jgi:uncharacterized protein (TIGR03032 family)
MVVGDDVGGEPRNPFHLHLSPGLGSWLAESRVAMAFSTYTAGKLIVLGPGGSMGIAVSERSFDRAMAMVPTDTGFYLSTEFQVWRFENGLLPGKTYQGWDRLYLPRTCHVTGAVDVHDLHLGARGRMFAAVTLYNCLATLDDRGSFSPLWRPPFVDATVGEDRCHLNGFCVRDGVPAYATLIGETNVKDGWREHRSDGGMVFDIASNEAVLCGLAMPHSPRLHEGRLWLLEAGAGHLGWVDPTARSFERIAWCPGFARGLRFLGHYALVGLSKPRQKVFSGLPLDDELRRRGEEPVCGIYVIDLRDGRVAHTLTISGSVEEIYDIALLPQARAPFIVGLQGEEVRRLIYLGPDRAGAGEGSAC